MTTISAIENLNALIQGKDICSVISILNGASQRFRLNIKSSGSKAKLSFLLWTDLNINLELCSIDEMFWMLDQNIFWRNHEKWEILSTINCIIKQTLHCHNEGCSSYEILPYAVKCKAISPHTVYEEEGDLAFPFTSSILKELYEKYDYLIPSGGYNFGYHNGIRGYKLNTPVSIFYNNPRYWVKCENIMSVDESSDTQKAYAIYCAAIPPNVFEKGKLYPLSKYKKQLYAQFEFSSDLEAGIKDESYMTHRYGGVMSYSGQTTVSAKDRFSGELRNLSVMGMSSQGSPHHLSKEGTICFEFQ